jgi:hypothetical protein
MLASLHGGPGKAPESDKIFWAKTFLINAAESKVHV